MELQSSRVQLVLKEYDCLVGWLPYTFWQRGTCQKEAKVTSGSDSLAKDSPRNACHYTGVRRQTVAVPQASGPARGSQELDLMVSPT